MAQFNANQVRYDSILNYLHLRTNLPVLLSANYYNHIELVIYYYCLNYLILILKQFGASYNLEDYVFICIL